MLSFLRKDKAPQAPNGFRLNGHAGNGGTSGFQVSQPAPASPLHPVGSMMGAASRPFAKIDTQPMSAADFVDSSVFAGSEAQPNVIRTIADFPEIKGVMTSVGNSDPSLSVPAELQDALIAVRLGATHARIYIDPAQAGKALAHVPTIQAGLGASGLSSGSAVHYAEGTVIRAIRLSAEASDKQVGRVGRGSDGVKLFKEWAAVAHEERATDIHVQLREGGKAKVTIRVDGVLEPIPGSEGGIFTDRDAGNALKGAYEVLSDRHSNNLGTFSLTATLSSMIDAALGIPGLRLRFATVRGMHGPKGVIRLLPSASEGGYMTFDQMGFAPSQIELFEQAQSLRSGAVGQIGVTGSGKTTTARTYIEGHPGYGSMSMYQVADPVEYPLVEMQQIPVQRDLLTLNEAGQKDPYSVIVDSLLRLNPELVDLGEVRDVLSARAMASVAKSGHLALFTLHADSVQGAINRLIDPRIGLSREELTIGSMLSLLDYQALVPLLCPKCCNDEREALAQLRSLGGPDGERDARRVERTSQLLVERFGLDRQRLRYKNAGGCTHCRGRGTKGLTIVAEVVAFEDAWMDLAAKGQEREAMRWWRQQYSDRDLRSGNQHGKLVIEHAIYKAHLGSIDPREVARLGNLQTLEVIQ